jgi:hypothetical protein
MNGQTYRNEVFDILTHYLDPRFKKFQFISDAVQVEEPEEG